MVWTEVYVGLSGNIGDVYQTQLEALKCLKALSGVADLEVSKFYWTTPCYIQQQNKYLNAVCRFRTTLSPQDLWRELQSIQILLGQGPKPKNAPRRIDLDLLFYGEQTIATDELVVPHPRWSERLFVLRPLMDLTSHIGDIDLQHVMSQFVNIHNETVQVMKENADATNTNQ